MAAAKLHDLSLGYQLLWNAQRRVAGVLLTLEPEPGKQPDATQALSALAALWNPSGPALIIRTASRPLLADWLVQTPKPGLVLEIASQWLSEPALAQQVLRAPQRGLALAWRGQPGEQALPAFAASFSHHIVSLSAENALAALRVSLRKLHGSSHQSGLRSASPVRAGQIYEGVASRALSEHCLDQQHASALLGWPTEDVLYGFRHARIQPDLQAIQGLISAIGIDAPLEQIERGLSEEPILAYRFLRYVNSAGLALRQEIDSLRQGLMVLGLTRTKNWLHELLPNACSDPNLQPIRHAMVLRARFMVQLMDAGQSVALQRELYLCGLLSQIDLLLGESMADALRGLVLPGRTKEAILSQTGPYWPYLDMATTLEAADPQASRTCCARHGFTADDVNLALLRTLTGEI